MNADWFIDFLEIGLVILLIFINGFLVAAEFALASVRHTRIEELAQQGNRNARWAKYALENPQRIFAAIQLGITMASLGLGWIGEPALAQLLIPIINLFPHDLQNTISHSISAGISFALITFLLVVVGELAPKYIALQNPEKTALLIVQPILAMEWIFKPIIWLLNSSGLILLRMVGFKPSNNQEMVHSVEELKMIVTASAEKGVVRKEESEMLHAIFDLGEQLVRQVMIPRTEIVAVEAETPLPQIIDLISETTYTKFPVYDDNLDQIIGIVHIKDLLHAMQSDNCLNCTARSLVREALFVPETLTVRALLERFRTMRQHIAIVMDEFGGTAGLVTLEDLLEEIVGEVSDPFDRVRPA
ncbi:MAG: hemolysin family protein, partial [Anaerolineales bacterium]